MITVNTHTLLCLCPTFLFTVEAQTPPPAQVRQKISSIALLFSTLMLL